ncbi:MAG: RNA pyrophosphohydrolase [Gammaproteobacteria bacterium]|nr:RNA pyrophosphohydrolase [Gammaproteobacteria bacterium]
MNKPYSLIEDPNYRPNVGIMLVNQKKQVLAGEAIHYPGKWMMPQGGIDQGETPQQAMQRELVEETGILYEDVEFIKENEEWLAYLFRKPLVKDGRSYIGQRQKWFLLAYDGPLPNAETTVDKEFLQFDWVEPEWLIAHTTKFKTDVYQTVFSGFLGVFPDG